MIRRVVLLATLLLAVPIALAAQEPAAKRQVLSIQPLSALLGVYAVEYERALGEGTSLAFGLNYWDDPFADEDSDDEFRYFSPEMKLRFYPSAEVLRKFSFGATAGWTFVENRFDPLGVSNEKDKASGLKIGVDLDYSWLLGKRDNFALSLGAGARRLFLKDRLYDGADVAIAYPTLRIAVGYAF